MIIKHKIAEIDLSGKTWEEVCIIFKAFEGIEKMPIYWEPMGTHLIYGIDEDGNHLIRIIR